MKTVFLSFRFEEEDRELVDLVQRIIESHGLLPVTGRRLGGGGLTREIQARIAQCDALVAVLTREQETGDGRFLPSMWVRDELQHARSENLPTIGLVEGGVDTTGMHSEREWVALDRASPAEALASLSETLHLWKALRVKVQLLPQEVAEQVGDHAGQVEAHYRTVVEGRYSGWRVATLVPETGGTFAYVWPRTEDELIELQLEHDGTSWRSRATQQWVRVELRSED
jgi:hypothetical protein